MSQATSKNTTTHKNKRKSISKLFHAQTGFKLVPIWFLWFRLFLPTSQRFLLCSHAHALFQDRFRCSSRFKVVQYTVHPLTKLSQIFRPQMRPKNCCTSLATSKFGKLLTMLKWVGMRNCWQMVEKWTWWKSWNWLTCEIVDKSLKYGNYKRNVLSLQPQTKSWPGLLA